MRFNNLSLTIEPLNGSYFSKVSESIIFSHSPVTSFASINFVQSTPNYPSLSSSSRPTAEFSASSSCCQDPFDLTALVNNPLYLEKYTYNITSYPPITIIPSSGIFAANNSGGQIKALAYLDGQKSSSIHITLTHDESQNSVSDSVILRCPQSTWT